MDGIGFGTVTVGVLALLLGLVRLILVTRSRRPGSLHNVLVWLPVVVGPATALSVFAHLAGWPDSAARAIDAACLGTSIGLLGLLTMRASRLSYEHNNAPTQDRLDHLLDAGRDVV